MRGRLSLAYGCADDGQTRLAHLEQVAPLRALFPLTAPGDIAQAAIITTSGGVVGGDRLDLTMVTHAHAQVQYVAQAAEKIYRSAGPDSHICVDLQAGPDSWLEYLPQETILFQGARLRRRTRLFWGPQARILAGEMLVFGRTAMGERFTRGLLHEEWQIWRENQLIWADRMRLQDDIAALLDAPAGGHGAQALATLVLACPSPSKHLPAVRQLLEDQPHAAAGVVNEVLLIRWLAKDVPLLRQSFATLWCHLRAAEAGLPAQLPRLWHI